MVNLHGGQPLSWDCHLGQLVCPGIVTSAVCLIMIRLYVPLFVCSWERCKFLFEIIQGGFPGGWVGWFLGWGACALVGLRRLVICFMWVCGSFVISSH